MCDNNEIVNIEQQIDVDKCSNLNKIADKVPIHNLQHEYDFVKNFKKTERSTGGFGHSGTS